MKRRKTKQQIQSRLQSRRQFLIGAGHFALTLPPLISLMPREVLAMLPKKVVRTVSCLAKTGIDYHQWAPAEQNGMTQISGQEAMYYKPLANISGPISRVIDSSFSDLYPYMNVITGLSLTGGLYQGHNNTVLSGTHSGGRDPLYGKSIDVILEQSSNVYGPSDIVYKKAIRMQDGDHSRYYSFDRVNGAVVTSPHLQGDLALFNSLMTGLTQGQGPTQETVNKRLVVDRVFDDLKKLERHRRISKSDKELLDRYISAVTDLQRRVGDNTQLPPSCTQPNVNFQVTSKGNYWRFPRNTDSSSWGVTSIDAMFNNYIEMFKIAAMCDQTRVFHWATNTWDEGTVPGGMDGGLHHDVEDFYATKEEASQVQSIRQQYFVKKIAALARAFRDTPDPINGGNLLENSTIFYINELGAWDTSHRTYNMPTISFGNGGGKLSSGNYIDCRQRPLRTDIATNPYARNTPGRPYKQFLQAVMAAAGVPKSEYMLYGDGNGFGEFKEGIKQFGTDDPTVFTAYKNEHNDPLPFLYTG